MKVISLFTGAGGLDLGFQASGYDVTWANEFDKTIWETFEKNHPEIPLDHRSITDIPEDDIPMADGIIGGPPCQSWSCAGAMRGIDDKRGRLMLEYIRVLRHVKPRFFVLENVPGLVSSRHIATFKTILSMLEGEGYTVNWQVLNASDYGVPQDRKRVICIGLKSAMRFDFDAIEQSDEGTTLREAFEGLPEPTPTAPNATTSPEFPNHEYATGDFSSHYMSRQRVRDWDEPGFTVQASARHQPIHPSANPMIFVEKDKWMFDPESPEPYRRYSVRESARVQTFPDDFVFHYERSNNGYKMVGNAVPVEFARRIAEGIQEYY